MKIEINKPGPRAFYDEIVFILINNSKIRNNPTKPAKTMTGFMATRIIGYFLVAMVALYLAISKQDMIYMAIFGALLVAVVAVFITYRHSRKQVYELMDDVSPKTVEIDERGIAYTENAMELRYDWSDISCIILNKNSFAVLPKDKMKAMIFISTEYKDQVLRGLKEADHAYLLEDNVTKEK